MSLRLVSPTLNPPTALSKPRTPSTNSDNNCWALPEPSLGDTLQLLAIHRPMALKMLESWANRLAAPIRRKLDDEQRAG